VQEPVDRKGRASIAPASVRRIGGRRAPPPFGDAPIGDAPILEHSHGLVVGERLLEKLVEVRAIVRDDDELRNRLWLAVAASRLREILAATGWALRERDAVISGICVVHGRTPGQFAYRGGASRNINGFRDSGQERAW
jgi:hypothetical protein